MKTLARTNEKDDFLLKASFELYQIKAQLTERDFEELEKERASILNEIAQNETGISNPDQRSRLEELLDKEASLQSTWNELQISNSIEPTIETISQTEKLPNNTDPKPSETDITETLDELEQLRENDLDQEQDMDIPDY